jgi:hypothetical protein
MYGAWALLYLKFVSKINEIISKPYFLLQTGLGRYPYENVSFNIT